MFHSSPSAFCSQTGIQSSKREAGPWYNTSLPCHPPRARQVSGNSFPGTVFLVTPAIRLPTSAVFLSSTAMQGKGDAFHFRLILEEALRTKKDTQEESLKESLAWVSPCVSSGLRRVCSPESTLCVGCRSPQPWSWLKADLVSEDIWAPPMPVLQCPHHQPGWGTPGAPWSPRHGTNPPCGSALLEDEMLVAPWDPAGAEGRSIIFLLIPGCSNLPVCLGAALTWFPRLPLPLSARMAWEIRA